MTSTAAPGSTPPPRLAAKAGLAACGERPYATSTEACCAVRSLNQYPCVARRRVPSPLLCFARCGTVGIQYRVAERSWGCGAATRCDTGQFITDAEDVVIIGPMAPGRLPAVLELDLAPWRPT
jgi:hypothetical protein